MFSRTFLTWLNESRSIRFLLLDHYTTRWTNNKTSWVHTLQMDLLAYFLLMDIFIPYMFSAVFQKYVLKISKSRIFRHHVERSVSEAAPPPTKYSQHAFWDSLPCNWFALAFFGWGVCQELTKHTYVPRIQNIVFICDIHLYVWVSSNIPLVEIMKGTSLTKLPLVVTCVLDNWYTRTHRPGPSSPSVS